MESPLTPNQTKVLNYIVQYFGQNKKAPSQIEISVACQIKQSNISKYLAALNRRGCIVYYNYVPRGIELRNNNGTDF